MFDFSDYAPLRIDGPRIILEAMALYTETNEKTGQGLEEPRDVSTTKTNGLDPVAEFPQDYDAFGAYKVGLPSS